MLPEGLALNQRNQQVADDDCVGNTLCGTTKQTEQFRSERQQNTEYDLSLRGDRAGHIVGCHKEGTEDQSAAADVSQNEVQIVCRR